MKSYDVIILGGGPAAMEAAYHLKKNKKNFRIVSATPLGGRATWNSLVPGKILLELAEKFNSFRELRKFGIKQEHSSILDFELLRQRIKNASQEIHGSYAKKYEAFTTYGKGFLIDKNKVKVQTETGEEILEAEYIILATGSKPRFLPEVKPNKKRIIAPKLFPLLNEVPPTIAMIGAGVTNMEFAYAYASLGSKVTVFTADEEILKGFDKEIAGEYRQTLTELYGIEFRLNTSVMKVRQEGEKVLVNEEFSYDYAFIGMGRIADFDFYDSEKVPLEKDVAGFLKVNKYGQTSIPNVYAIGDLTGNPMNVNKAFLQAKNAVMHILEKDMAKNIEPIHVSAVYTSPTFVSIGNTSEDLQTLTFSYTDVVRRAIAGEDIGKIKLFFDENYSIVGATAFGRHAEDVLNIITLAIKERIKVYQLAELEYPHPTYSERLRKLK